MQSYKSSSSSPTARTCVLASSSWEVVQYNRKQLPFEDDHCERVESIHHGGATMSPKIVFVLVVESSRKSQIESSSTTGRLSTIWLELRRRTSYLYAISMQLSRKPQKDRRRQNRKITKIIPSGQYITAIKGL